MLKSDSVLTYTVFITNHNSFKMVILLNTYNLLSVHVFTIDLAYFFSKFFRGWTGVIKCTFIPTNTHPPRFTRYRRISWSCVWNCIHVYVSNAKNIGRCLWSANQQITSHILTPVVWSENLTTCDQRHLTLISWKIRCKQEIYLINISPLIL